MVRSTLARRLTSVALAATASVTVFAFGGAAVAPTPPAPAPKQRAAADHPQSVVSPAAEKRMLAQVPLIKAANRVEALARSVGSPIGGVELAVPAKTVSVYWKGRVPARIMVAIKRLDSGRVRVVVHPARYTERELIAAASRIMDRRTMVAAQLGSSITQVDIHPDGSGITVGVLALPHSSRRARASRVVIQSIGVRAADIQARPALIPDDRIFDIAPHWAGALMSSVGGIGTTTVPVPVQCSTSFPVKRTSDGRTFIPSAAHCDDSGTTEWWAAGLVADHEKFDRTSNQFIGDTWYVNHNLDTMYIRPPGGAVEGDDYDGSYDSTGNDFNWTFKPVEAIGTNFPCGFVCTSGGATGVHCSIKVGNQVETDVEGINVLEWQATQTSGGVDTGQGDSGGPVFSLIGNGSTEAANGDITGGFTEVPCGNIAWTLDTDNESCQSDLAFVDFHDVLNWLGATLVTG